MLTETYISEITDLLERFTQDAHEQKITGNRSWTLEIKKRLTRLGENYGYKTCASGFGGDCEPEWLYDIVWYKEEGEGHNARLTGVSLVAESEWNLDFKHIKYDFEKLLLANASLKLMICQGHVKSKDGLMEYFKQAISKYKAGQRGDIFLIAILDCNDEEFYFESITR
jgi:hypothetical protein